MLGRASNGCWSLRVSPLVILQSRSYWFFPTSWSELRLRLRAAARARTLQIPLLRQRPRYRPPVVAAVRAQWARSALRKRSTLWRFRLRSSWRRSSLRSKALWSKNKALGRQQLSRMLLPVWERSKGLVTRSSVSRREKLSRLLLRPLYQRYRVAQTYYHHRRRRRAQRASTDSYIMKTVVLTEHVDDDTWFCTQTGRPRTSRDATGRFVNPWQSESSAGVYTLATLLSWRWQRWQRRVWGNASLIDDNDDDESFPLLPRSITTTSTTVNGGTTAAVAATDINDHSRQEDLSSPMTKEDQVRCTWLGHSTCLVQTSTVTMLTDPIFSDAAAPTMWRSIIGVHRSRPSVPWTLDTTGRIVAGNGSASRTSGPATRDSENHGQQVLDAANVPMIDICLISHDHYDHLDERTVRALREKVRLWVVPTGTAEWLEIWCELDRESIVEVEWWETVRLERNEQGHWQVKEKSTLDEHPHHHPMFSSQHDTVARSSGEDKSLWVTGCPAQHWCGRTAWDRNFRLWTSFACFLPIPGHAHFSLYHVGDTALPKHFPMVEQIADYFLGRPMDLCILPIGAYRPAELCRDVHMTPVNAIHFHRTLQSRKSIGVHWGSFFLTEEPLDEPALWLHNMDEPNFLTVPQGHSIRLKPRRVERVFDLSVAKTATSLDQEFARVCDTNS